jgi:hypothetical protein
VTEEEPSLFGDRDGSTYESDLDSVRLNRQAAIVWRLMRDGHWRTLAEISEITGCPEASVSARLRDFRKERFGSHTVERERALTISGLFYYRLIPRERDDWVPGRRRSR